MSPTPPSLEEWRALYEAAGRFYELAPWTWLYEDNLFAIVNPEDGETGYASVMGMRGEYLALALYFEPEGFYGFYRMHTEDLDPLDSFEVYIGERLLQASFESRDSLNERDRQVIRDLGLKFRGRQSWPLFRDHTPGYAPWYVDAAQARYLTLALDQVCELAARFQEDTAPLEDLLEDWECLVRIPHQTDDGLAWTEERRSLPREALLPALEADWDEADLEELQQLADDKRRQGSWELDYFYFPGAIQESRSERPYYARSILIVERDSRFILGNELARPDELAPTICRYLQRMLRDSPFWPRQMGVRQEALARLLFPLTEALDIELFVVEELAALTEARLEMQSFFE